MGIHYYEPESIKEASEILKQYPKAVPVAGGTDVMVRYNKRIQPFDAFVNIKKIRELNAEVTQEDGFICVGSLIKHNQLIMEPLLQKYYPALITAVINIGTNQIRNLGTLGGNICNASPCADSVAILTALGAVAVLSDGVREREVLLKEFFTGPGKTVLEQGELLTKVKIPIAPKGFRQYFEKIGRRKAAEISVVNIGMTALIEDEVVQETEMVLGSVGPKIVCPDGIRKLMIGKKVDTIDRDRVIETAVAAICPISDVRASAWYRTHVTSVLVKNALDAVLEG